MYTERIIPGVTQKIQIPYRGPYRIHKLYGQTAELIDGEKEIKVNVTKLVKLRNFTVPQRDLTGKVDTSVPVEDNKDDALERATDVTTRLMEHKKESKIVRMAKRKIDEVKGAVEDRKTELEIDEDEEIAEEPPQEVEDKAEQKVIEEARKIKDREAKLKAKAKSRPAMKVKLSARDLPVGALAIAYASGEKTL